MPHRLAPALLGLLVLLAVPAADPAVSGAAASAAATDWRWPVDPPHPVVRQYLAPATPYGAGHRGIDIGSAGSGVFAPADGVVSFAGVVVGRPVLAIRHPGGLVSSYEPVESMLKPGDAVSRGQPIGTLLGGHCASLCLRGASRWPVRVAAQLSGRDSPLGPASHPAGMTGGQAPPRASGAGQARGCAIL